MSEENIEEVQTQFEPSEEVKVEQVDQLETPVEASAEPTAESTEVVTSPVEIESTNTGAMKCFYNGQEVMEKSLVVNGDGRLCTLADGTTAYVPLNILGE